MNIRTLWKLGVFAAALGSGLPAAGQTPGVESAAPRHAADSGTTEAAVPDYSGDWRSRAYLSGDWDASRTRLAQSGLTFDLSWTQIAQGVVGGGRRRDWDYGGNLDLLMTADLARLGLAGGGTVSLRAESRYGETVNDDSGAFTPVNTRGYFPLTDRINEGVPLAITELSYSHSLSDTLEVTVGKMLTAEGDPTEFAGGLGRTQFLDSNFIYNAATSQTAPYSALGASIDWSPAWWLTVSTALFTTTDPSTTSGFDHLGDGWTWWTQAATQYRLGGLPGGLNAGFQYGFGNEFIRINGKLSLLPGGGVALPTVRDSWAVSLGGWQYLYSPDRAPDAIDASDGHADIRGVGLFARLGIADPDANPIRWSGSVGLGGRGVIPERDDDTFGVGCYYTDVQNARAFTILGLPSSTRGCEAFYNLAITPAVGLTFDVQWIDEGPAGTSPATTLGVRLSIEF